ncbi:hypothetical protein TWF694_000779 [Orbilia ellipsospora]|uniref:Rhodopsin domain-containing protein n=1 Tax=Orbilia ellipsospora TaxID=2528407 RepID=A0AAV9XWA2_9PEZI
MGQIPSHVPKPTTEQRNEMFALLGMLANASAAAGKSNHSSSSAMTKEQIAELYSPDYVPPTMDQEVVALTVIMVFFQLSSIILRFVSRYRYGAQNGPMLDDWLVLLATVFTIAYSVVNMCAFLWAGFGRFTYDLTVEQFNHCLELIIVNFTTSAIANTAVKVSVLVLYRRIFDSMQTKMRIIIYSLIGIVIMFCPISIMVLITPCRPIRAYYDIRLRLDPNTKCNSGVTQAYVVGAIRAFLDIIIFSLPLKHIWEIKTFTFRKKIAISSIFTLGLIACVASAVKLILYREFLNKDLTRGIFDAVVAESLECTSAIVAACVPALLPMLKSVYRNTTSTIRHITSGSKSQTPSTTTHIAGGPSAPGESIRMKGIKVSHVVSQTIEVHKEEEEDDTELILQMQDDIHDNFDGHSKGSHSANHSQTSV